MMKKMMAAFLALALIFTPAGNFVFHLADNPVSAKGYHSGIKSFNTTKSGGTRSLFQNRQQGTRQNPVASATRSFTSGGFMRGLIFGGLSGLLFGSLLSHFGGFGMIAGFLFNVLVIIAIIALVRYLVVGLMNRSRRDKNEGSDPWKR
ncbi:hypothetical protein [Sporolactobacillus putidus]|uniref:Preprotein translocase subunit Tim44 n=1 Tax=Sporolactobacillus putidus TaxID=492735 RepID=A0A917SA88_9BACL|nr:hypothetical protein [Sporolactobacillus putidus]GGL65524.1 hypothetical protein GCM10007968_31900 [Sporolactobacillus putidus]